MTLPAREFPAKVRKRVSELRCVMDEVTRQVRAKLDAPDYDGELVWPDVESDGIVPAAASQMFALVDPGLGLSAKTDGGHKRRIGQLKWSTTARLLREAKKQNEADESSGEEDEE